MCGQIILFISCKGCRQRRSSIYLGVLIFPRIHQNPLLWDTAAPTHSKCLFFVCYVLSLTLSLLRKIKQYLKSTWEYIFPQMNEFNIALFTLWLFVEDWNPGVYNMGFFCNLGVFSKWGTYVNKIKIFVYVSRVLHLLDLVTEDVYFIVGGEWCHWDYVVGKCETIKWRIYTSTVFWCIGIKQRIIIGVVVK